MIYRAEDTSPLSGGVRVVAWILAATYAVGAPAAAIFEYVGGALSARFGYPPEFIYLVSLVQFICAIGLTFRRYARPSAAVLTAIALGAVASHLRIGSPLTALPALVCVLVQVWLLAKLRGAGPEGEEPAD